jgi:hypothetical protein
MTLWPMNIDLDSMGAIGGMQQESGQQSVVNGMPSASTASNPSNVFLGASGAGAAGNGMM